MRVAVKFCGNCRPGFDAWALYLALTQELKSCDFVFWTEADGPEGLPPDCLLLINSCPASCATQPVFEGPLIMVSPSCVDHVPVAEGSLLQELIFSITKLQTSKQT